MATDFRRATTAGSLGAGLAGLSGVSAGLSGLGWLGDIAEGQPGMISPGTVLQMGGSFGPSVSPVTVGGFALNPITLASGALALPAIAGSIYQMLERPTLHPAKRNIARATEGRQTFARLQGGLAGAPTLQEALRRPFGDNITQGGLVRLLAEEMDRGELGYPYNAPPSPKIPALLAYMDRAGISGEGSVPFGSTSELLRRTGEFGRDAWRYSEATGGKPWWGLIDRLADRALQEDPSLQAFVTTPEAANQRLVAPFLRAHAEKVGWAPEDINAVGTGLASNLSLRRDPQTWLDEVRRTAEVYGPSQRPGLSALMDEFGAPIRPSIDEVGVPIRRRSREEWDMATGSA